MRVRSRAGAVVGCVRGQEDGGGVFEAGSGGGGRSRAGEGGGVRVRSSAGRRWGHERGVERISGMFKVNGMDHAPAKRKTRNEQGRDSISVRIGKIVHERGKERGGEGISGTFKRTAGATTSE